MPEACFGPLARSGAASRSFRSPLAPALALVIPHLLAVMTERLIKVLATTHLPAVMVAMAV